ncbi:DUF2236 domain-containing protein [Nocardioides sp. W3-2-3]|uniref:oxygenase MpaB family protein n=1 Tax=Nocardioides convexus TaxID=2712224 RepID=UPI002418A47F|nr:oxygenase MpaB family protein [Nocardioides convexus]NHA01108.1 DUF2236 domain-containing protein [Nocardioides convexus]
MTVAPWHPSQPHAALAADVRRWLGTPAAFALYGRLALDQVAYREVAAAVDASGRFAANFTDRGIRSSLWGPLLLFGDDADRAATANRLKHLHGEVRGRGKGHFAGERYSALDPDLWKWVGTTSLLVFHTGYVTTYPRLSEPERDAVYATVLHLADLDLPSDRARVPRTRAEAEAYYDEVAATRLADNPFLQWADARFDALPVPTLVGPRWLQARADPGLAAADPGPDPAGEGLRTEGRPPTDARACSVCAGPAVGRGSSASTPRWCAGHVAGCRPGCCWTRSRPTGCATNACGRRTRRAG